MSALTPSSSRYYLSGYLFIDAASEGDADRKVVEALGSDGRWELDSGVTLCFEGPWDEIDPIVRSDCECPPGLVARGGFRSACKTHGALGGSDE